MFPIHEISNMLKNYEIPPIAEVFQTFKTEILKDAETILLKELEANCNTIHLGDRIAITCGSRGIDSYVTMAKTIVQFVKSKGGIPIIIPSMGSHGGATAEGQIDVLKEYGITEASTGAPIISSMEVVKIGTTEKGLPVYVDKNAYEADGIILFNRIKPHTSFRGKYESGLLKMLAIGLAKQKGAEMTHFLRYDNMAENIRMVGTIGIKKLNIIAAVGTIEDGYGNLAEIHVLKKEDILEKEPEYLKKAWSLMPRLALDEIDCLIVKNIGKDISGTGMDTNLIGRYHTTAATGGPNIIKLGILNTTKKSEGNANGMGLADFMPAHMYDTIDFTASYINTLTSTEPNSTRMPMVLANDKEVFQACIKCSGQINNEDLRIVIIESTKHIDRVYMSKAAIKAAVMPIKTDNRFFPVPFDKNGNMLLF